MRTLQQLAQEALLTQDACNPRGLSKTYAKVVDELFDALQAVGLPCGTRQLCDHPINRLWASKLHDLANMGLSDSDRYHDAYTACRELAENLQNQE